MGVLMVFIDGIGIGAFDSACNPFARFPSPFFTQFNDRSHATLPYSGWQTCLDATMGVDGLPQSATGQTALLTGVNAAKVQGRHLPGFPTKTLREVIAAESVFLKLEKMNRTATFANAFAPEYFARTSRRISATTRAVQASGFPFRMIATDLLQDRAISHDLSNAFLRELGFDVPPRTPEQAAAILAQIAASVDFCLFEYFLTDRIGHDQNMHLAGEELGKLTRFLDTLLSTLDLRLHTVLLTSDHGNFEDLSVATHTRNRVPACFWGHGAREMTAAVSRIEDVPGAILHALASHG